MPYKNAITLKDMLEYLKNNDNGLDIMNIPILVEGFEDYEPLQLDQIGSYKNGKTYFVIVRNDYELL